MSKIFIRLSLSREYKRRSLLDQKDLLVKLDKFDEIEDEDVRRLLAKNPSPTINVQESTTKPTRRLLDLSDDEEQETEQRLIQTDDQSETIMGFRHRYLDDSANNDIAVVPKRSSMGDSSFDMLSDSSSSNADDETARFSEIYANLGEQIDGKHRIKIKGDEFKVKGRSNKQRSKLMDASFFQAIQNDDDDDDNNSRAQPSAPMLINSAATNQPNAEPDLTSFDFLNDYDEKQ